MDYSYDPEFIVADPSTKFRLVRNIVIVLLLAIFAARAFGALQFDYFSAETVLVHAVGQTANVVDGRNAGSVESFSNTRSTSTDSVWNYGISTRDAAIDSSTLAAEIAAVVTRSPNVANLNVVVDRFETTGSMWVPLRKSGTNNFTVSVTGSQIGSIVVSGTVETNVSGPATSRAVERLIADKVVAAVAKIVNDELKERRKKT